MKKIITVLLLLIYSTTMLAQKKILFVMSAANSLKLKNGKIYKTGIFLNEFYLAYKAISEAGYAVDFATPEGIVPAIDPGSLDLKYWKGQELLKAEALSFVSTNQKFNTPKKLEDIMAHRHKYIGLIIPGGQGLMTDLLYNNCIPLLLNTFMEEKKIIGLICHAPALLLTIPSEDHPFKGYCVNAVSRFEEFYIENFVMKGKPYRRKIAKHLRHAGLKYESGRPGTSFAVRDRTLVTSQNPFSSHTFTTLYLECLKDYGY